MGVSILALNSPMSLVKLCLWQLPLPLNITFLSVICVNIYSSSLLIFTLTQYFFEVLKVSDPWPLMEEILTEESCFTS